MLLRGGGTKIPLGGWGSLNKLGQPIIIKKVVFFRALPKLARLDPPPPLNSGNLAIFISDIKNNIMRNKIPMMIIILEMIIIILTMVIVMIMMEQMTKKIYKL